ncbi:MAG: threonine-phosphate decarboxylase [Salinirussus sp.]
MDPDGVDRLAGDRVHHGSRDDPEVLDFSANTNPRTPDGVAGVYGSALAAAGSYPADDYADFRAAAGTFVDCDPDRVVVTAGGLAAIRLAVATTVRSGDRVLVPAPTFGEYAREVRLQGGEPDFRSPGAVLDTDPEPYALAVLCVPNNPTGWAPDPARLRAYADRCRAADTPLLVDEAFLGFTGRASLAGHEGVVVARSLTKLFGLPGLRAGFAVATGRELARLRAARPPWSLGTPAAAVGTYCLGQSSFVAATRERVHSERERLRARLGERFEVHPSEAPFLLLTVEDVDGVLSEARAAGLALRDARTFRRLSSHVRVAVRTRADNDRLLAALDV